MEIEEFVCVHERCRFCGQCHWMGGCVLARPVCESARWDGVVEVLQCCGYKVTVGEGYVQAVMGKEQVAFVVGPEGLVAAEQWVEVNALSKLLQQLDRATRLSIWTVVKLGWSSLFGRRVECEACGCKFRPDEGYYEPGEYSYCRDCCHW